MSILKDKMTGDEMRELLDKKHAWDDGIHNPEFINDIRRHNWVLINNYPLAKLGSVEDPYNRLIEPDDDYAMSYSDLSEPIVIAPDRKTVLDGNHRVYKAREMGKTHLPAYFPMVKENKFNLKLIDKEISESRLFRSTRRFATLTGKDIANLMYLNNLIMVMLYLDKDFNKTAKQYANATAQYSTYALFRTHATDMYLLAYQICHPDNDNFNIKDPINSKKFLDRLQFSKDKHINFLRRIQRDYVDGSELTTYLFRLESQLNITDGRYKTWRRSVLDWPRLNDQNRRALVRRFQNELRVMGGGTGRGSELLISLDAINRPVAKAKPTQAPKPKPVVDKYSSKPSISKIEKFWSRKTV